MVKHELPQIIHVILVAYMCPAEMVESANIFLLAFSAISAFSAGVVQQFMVNYMAIHVNIKHELP